MKKKLIYILHGLRVSICSANVNFWVNYSFKTLKENVVEFILSIHYWRQAASEAGGFSPLQVLCLGHAGRSNRSSVSRPFP